MEISETFAGLSDFDLQFTEIVEKPSEVVGKIVCHLVEFNTRRENSSLRLSVYYSPIIQALTFSTVRRRHFQKDEAATEAEGRKKANEENREGRCST